MSNKHGGLFTYTHFNNKIVAVVSLTCETDFAERTVLFKQIGNEFAKQLACSDSESVENFLQEECITSDGIVSEQLKSLGKELKEKVSVEKILKLVF